jgi:hypothetical protein
LLKVTDEVFFYFKKKRMHYLFFLLNSAILLTTACPFYTLTTIRTNYTNITSGIQQGIVANKLPLHVCNGAQIGATEVVPVLSVNAAFIGDEVANPGGTGFSSAYLIAMTAASAPVFSVNASAYVTMVNIQFVYNSSLMYISGTGTLVEMTYCNFWLGGGIAVTVATQNGVDSGFAGEFLQFAGVGTALYQISGPLICTSCIFNSPKFAAVSVATNYLPVTLQITYSVWVNIVVYIYTQPNPAPFSSPPPNSAALSLITNWGRFNNNIQVITYTPDCVLPTSSATPSPLPAGGSSGGGGSGGASNSTKVSWINVGVLIFAFLALVVTASISIFRVTTVPR